MVQICPNFQVSVFARKVLAPYSRCALGCVHLRPSDTLQVTSHLVPEASEHAPQGSLSPRGGIRAFQLSIPGFRARYCTGHPGSAGLPRHATDLVRYQNDERKQQDRGEEQNHEGLELGHISLRRSHRAEGKQTGGREE